MPPPNLNRAVLQPNGIAKGSGSYMDGRFSRTSAWVTHASRDVVRRWCLGQTRKLSAQASLGGQRIVINTSGKNKAQLIRNPCRSAKFAPESAGMLRCPFEHRW